MTPPPGLKQPDPLLREATIRVNLESDITQKEGSYSTLEKDSHIDQSP